MSTSDDFLAAPGPWHEPEELTEFLPPDDVPPFQPSNQIWRVSLILFALTCGSTFLIGMWAYSGVDLNRLLAMLINGHPQRWLVLRAAVWGGLSYAGPLMSILLAHEFGHYLQARRYHVPAIPPMFIPFPLPPFGTMGAVIVQSPHHADRKAMFDIAISGPLAGLVLALPIAWLGIQMSKISANGAPFTGDPLILKWMVESVHGPLGPNQDVLMNPLLMAGWVGVFITALNLMPVGQLDGGHILYCLIGRKAHIVAVLVIGLAIAYMAYTHYWAYSLIVILMLVMGVKHPPTTNDNVPLGPVRVLLGWLTLAFVLIGIHPRPLQ